MQSKPRRSLAIKMKICKILDIAPAFSKYEKRNGSNFVILKIEQIWQLQKVKTRQKFGPTGIITEPPEFLSDSFEATPKYCVHNPSQPRKSTVSKLCKSLSTESCTFCNVQKVPVCFHGHRQNSLQKSQTTERMIGKKEPSLPLEPLKFPPTMISYRKSRAGSTSA
ncbi:hypothetical protein NC652_025603 [Populus alba x Populus x berolinensis]|nr:hypothetical protein NC652_025603 [Populus alba x Populus x berolinensis]